VPRVPTFRAAFLAATLILCASIAAPAAAQAHPGSLADSTRSTVETVWHGAQDLAIFALGLIGVDYRYGGNTPEDGLDCSGLVRHVFQQVTGVTLPRTSKELARVGKEVKRADLKPGDLVFFNTRRFAFSHVGIYLGDNQFIHAPRRGREVEVATLESNFWKRRFDGARRMAGVLPSLLPALVGEAVAAPLALPEADEIPTDR